MTSSRNDLKLLFQSTLGLYKRALVEAFEGVLLNWWAPLIPIFLVYLTGVFAPFFSFFGPVSGFIYGIFVALIIANSLALIEASVQKEKLLVKEVWSVTKEFFWPVISLLFTLWIFSFLSKYILLNGNISPWLIAASYLLLMILFNPLPEVAYLRRDSSGSNSFSMFQESFEFMKENAVEWLIAMFVILLPVLFFEPQLTLLDFSSQNPLSILFLYFQSYQRLGKVLFLPWFVQTVLISLVCFFIMVFRGLLYRELSTSTRRKRIYQMRMGI